MAEVEASENPQPVPDSMETGPESPKNLSIRETLTNTNGAGKRERQEEGREVEEEGGEESKKSKIDENKEEEEEEEEEVAASEKLGPKSFGSGEEMFNYFFKFLHFWSPNVNVNKYEHMVLLDLLEKGHAEASKKIGVGIQAFQIRFHPKFKSRCFFIVRTDGTSEDFSFRKCVDHLLPLPENMKLHSSSDEKKTFNGKNSGGHQKRSGGGCRGGGRGRGHGRRGGK